MLQIQNTLVSLDLIERFFHCDLDKCLGECCVEGDAGAPLLPEEEQALKDNIERILPLLSPRAQELVREQGPAYTDSEGDLVTSILDGRDCVFTTYAPGGKCLCALEKAYREGSLPQLKPISCHLYPVRLKEYDGFTAVNCHKWKICRCAETLGCSRGIRAYEFLKEPLTRRFGAEWYSELELTAREWLKSHPEK